MRVSSPAFADRDPNMDAIAALTQRVSAGPLVDPAPDDAALATIFAAATRAPDHGRLRPWRFFVVRGDARHALGELLVAAARRRDPATPDAQLERERAKPLRAPLVLVVAARVDHAHKIPAIEQVLSAGTAAQNVMLAAFALGYGCAWKTGGPAYDDAVKAAFGLAPGDAIVGFLYLGTHAKPPLPPPALDPAQFVTEWTGA
jgi:nitroreductase